MSERHSALDDLLQALRDIVVARQPKAALDAGALAAFQRLKTASEVSNATPAMIDACRDLASALETARHNEEPSVRAAAEAFAMIAPRLAWSRRKGSAAAGEPFHSGHANAILIGPSGLELRSDITLGLSLMGPRVQYPVHRHPPNELYVVLSEGDWFREGDGWFTPSTGGVVFNPPNAVHSMRAGNTPLFAFWLLWGVVV